MISSLNLTRHFPENAKINFQENKAKIAVAGVTAIVATTALVIALAGFTFHLTAKTIQSQQAKVKKENFPSSIFPKFFSTLQSPRFLYEKSQSQQCFLAVKFLFY